ncbi:ferric iron reductase FhuF [Chitinimonas prasina]|uniref:Ferric iron reductase FhuF n=2 Tax=Chitinimonas prasina TaxID=1434937 RepID=A0ABQ5YCP9_9NEIS|nr:ferric iron reductase FhuF [Chitinimonas prasina]
MEKVDPRQWLIGPLAPYTRCMVLAPDGAEEFPVSSLLDPACMAEVLAPYARLHPGAPRRALVSQWSKRYFASLLIPMVPLLLAGWRMPQAMGALHLRLNAQGEVCAFRYAEVGAPMLAGQAAAERWLPLMDQHLQTLIAALAKHGKVSQRVLWNNLGNLLEAIFGQLAKLPQPPLVLEQDRAFLLENALWPGVDPDGPDRRNPMRHPVHYVAPLIPEVIAEPTRLRRHCCLRHEVPGVVYCATCPHLTALNQTQLHALMEHWHHED